MTVHDIQTKAIQIPMCWHDHGQSDDRSHQQYDIGSIKKDKNTHTQEKG